MRSLLKNGEVFDRVRSCKRMLGEMQGILIELRAVRSLLEEF